MLPAEQTIANCRVVPVAKIDRVADAVPLASALKSGGLPIIEITLRTEAALDAICEVAQLEGMCVGAGTVLNARQAEQAFAVGARFIVSPGFDLPTVQFCQQNRLAVFPGVGSASEVQMAWNAGVRMVKFFPAEASGGIAMLKALAAPFHEMKFVPTGGITAENMASYLGLGCVLAVGGSWMVKPELFDLGNFDRVTKLAKQAIQVAAGESK